MCENLGLSKLMINSAPFATPVLLIDGNAADRACFAEGLKRCTSDYLILEATDGKSGLDLYRRSRRIDCEVLELDLPDRSGFEY